MRPVVILLLLGLSVTAGCSRRADIIGTEEGRFRGYLPVEPVPVRTVKFFDPAADSCVEKHWASLSTSDKLALLPLQTAEVSVKQLNVGGAVKFLGSSASGSKGSYEVVMDYMKYYVDTVIGADEKLVGSRRIGVGLRMTARVQTHKAGINIAGLGPLATEATLDNLTGSLSVNVIGIDSRDVTNLIPITSQLDQTSIQSALQALAAVKTKMWDTSETTITPHVVAVQQRRDNSVDQLLLKESYQYEETSRGWCIEVWWKPGGVVDTARAGVLRQWLADHSDAGAPSVIGDLITGAGLEGLREKAISDLNIPCRQP